MITNLITLLSNRRSGTSKWWLGNGAVPESDTYTVYDPLAAASLSESLVNLANPGTRDATVIVTPAHAQGIGWTFTGTEYLNTNDNRLGDEATLIIWAEDAAGVYQGGYLNTSPTPTRWFAIRFVQSNQTAFFKGSNSPSATASHPTRGGVLAMNATKGYMQGVEVANLPVWSGSTPNRNFYIGTRQLNGSTVDNFGHGRILRMALYPTSLTGEQIEAVTRSMVNYQNNLARNSYVSKVLATNPVCYWPCTQNIGSFLEDVSGNKAHGMAYFTPVGQTANDYGKTIAGVSGDENKYITSTPNWATLTGLNLNEFSCGGWFKVSDNPANQIRPFNHRANSLTEYATPEIRDGLTLGIFMRESGVDQNVSSVVELPDNEWVHIVFYNSLSAGEMGFYVGATRYNISKTTPGFTDTSPDQVLCGQELEGFFNHLSWWDHSVSQSTVNSLL